MRYLRPFKAGGGRIHFHRTSRWTSPTWSVGSGAPSRCVRAWDNGRTAWRHASGRLWALGQELPKYLMSIADANTGLTVEVDDWLRGRVRVSSATAMAASQLLGATAAGDFVAAFAPLILDCLEVKAQASRQEADVLRVCNRVDAIAASLGLSIAGQQGEVTEYRPAVHITGDGVPPADPLIRIIRPMVVRSRPGGSPDIIVRAVVVPT